LRTKVFRNKYKWLRITLEILLTKIRIYSNKLNKHLAAISLKVVLLKVKIKIKDHLYKQMVMFNNRDNIVIEDIIQTDQLIK